MWVRARASHWALSNRMNRMLCWPLFFLPDWWFHIRFSPCRTCRYETLITLWQVHICSRFFTGAFFNGVFLLALALSICLQSIERFINIQPVDSPLLVLIMACTGLGLNIISAFVIQGKFLLLLIKSFMRNFRFNSEYIFRPSWPWPQPRNPLIRASRYANSEWPHRKHEPLFFYIFLWGLKSSWLTSACNS